jgi:hypothetical protein
MVYYATDTGQVFYCSDGTSNTWIEQTAFTGPLSVTNNLEVASQIRMPAKALHDDVSDLMNPFAHAARHLVSGADSLSGLVNQIISTGSNVTMAIVQSAAYPIPDQTILSVGFDFTGRSGASTVLFFANVAFVNSSATFQQDFTFAFFLDSVEVTNPNAIRAEVEIDGNSDEGTVTLVGWLNTVSAAAHTIEVKMGAETTTASGAKDRMLMGLDLGLT